MNPEAEYNFFITEHKKYNKKAISILFKEFRSQFKNIDTSRLSFNTQENFFYVFANIDKEALQKTLYKIDYTIGVSHGRKFYARLKKENPIQLKKWKPYPLFSEKFQEFLLDYYKRKGGELIVTLSRTMAEKVTQDIINATYEGESVAQMVDRMRRTINDPNYYDWQILRIANTETTFAMNAANHMTEEVSGLIMIKKWIGRNDGRERSSHVAKNGTSVGQNEYFKFANGVELRFPGDRDGKGSRKAIGNETINCRCTMGYEPKRDENGRLIFTDF